MNRAQKEKVREIANFIVNNITLAEVTSIVIERATEYAEVIIRENLDPENFNSALSRKRLHLKLRQLNEKKARGLRKGEGDQESEMIIEKRSLLQRLFSWLFPQEEEALEDEENEIEKRFKTRDKQ